MSRLTLILGGARSGKSRYAQEIAQEQAGSAPVLYLATAQAGDTEMAERIRRHQNDRPAHWHTVEEPLAVAAVLRHSHEFPVILIDCLTFLVTNHLLKSEDWETEGAAQAVHDVISATRDISGEVIVVSNEVGLGLVPETPLGRIFRDVAGRANQDIAAAADRVILMVAGIPVKVK